MKVTAGILGIIGAFLAFMFSLWPLFMGGVGSTIGAGNTLFILGWIDVVATIAAFICAILCFSAKNHMPGLLLLLSGLIGVILGIILSGFYLPLFMAVCAAAGALAIYDSKQAA